METRNHCSGAGGGGGERGRERSLGREAGEALAPLTSVFLFRALFISPPPAALLSEPPLRAGASRRCLPRAGGRRGKLRHPAPRAAARRHRQGRGPGRHGEPPTVRGGLERSLPAAWRRLSPPSAPASAPGAGYRPPSRPARGQAQPGATAPCAPCERAAPGAPAQQPWRPKRRANFCSSAGRSC